MTEQFDSEGWNKTLLEAVNWFNQECRAGESIGVSAHSDRGDCAIFVKYNTIRDRTLIGKSVFIPIFFIDRHLSQNCRFQIYADLLNGWRGN